MYNLILQTLSRSLAQQFGLIDWLDRVLRHIGNISAMYWRRLLVKCDHSSMEETELFYMLLYSSIGGRLGTHDGRRKKEQNTIRHPAKSCDLTTVFPHSASLDRFVPYHTSAVWRKAPLNRTIFRLNLEKMAAPMVSMLTSSTIDGCDFYNLMQLFGNS